MQRELSLPPVEGFEKAGINASSRPLKSEPLESVAVFRDDLQPRHATVGCDAMMSAPVGNHVFFVMLRILSQGSQLRSQPYLGASAHPEQGGLNMLAKMFTLQTILTQNP